MNKKKCIPNNGELFNQDNDNDNDMLKIIENNMKKINEEKKNNPLQNNELLNNVNLANPNTSDYSLGIDPNDPTYKKFIQPDVWNLPKMNSDELKPKNTKDWFSDLSLEVTLQEANLLSDAISKQGVNTVGSSKKQASYDIRGNYPNPKFVIWPWGNSSIEPDQNLKGFC